MSSTRSNPATSPRLPSPPPFPEVQISPTPVGLNPAAKQPSPSSLPPSSSLAATRRIRPGTKSCNITPGPPLTDLSELDSAFQLQEHLAALLAATTHMDDATQPLSRADCQRLATPPPGIDDVLWAYELTRRLVRDLNRLLTALLADGCSAATCPEMRASEWQYLCAVHETPQSCCAIDYSTHTLDNAATMLTSTKYFPSRLRVQANSFKYLASVFRRCYRVFAHAWFQHREVFWEVEGVTGLYRFFKTVADRYGLIPEDNLTLPAEAEGEEDGDDDGREREDEVVSDSDEEEDDDEEDEVDDEDEEHHQQQQQQQAAAEETGKADEEATEGEKEDSGYEKAKNEGQPPPLADPAGQSLRPVSGEDDIVTPIEDEASDEAEGEQPAVAVAAKARKVEPGEPEEKEGAEGEEGGTGGGGEEQGEGGNGGGGGEGEGEEAGGGRQVDEEKPKEVEKKEEE